MHIPQDSNFCGRSTAANLIKAALSAPTDDLVHAFGKAARPQREERPLQGVSKRLRKELASAGMSIKGPTTSGYNGVEGSTVDVIRQIHAGGARKMSPVHLPPQSDNAASAPTAIHRHVVPPRGSQYRTPPYQAPPLFGAAPQSVSESNPALPSGNSDQYDKTVAAIRGIHAHGPIRGYLR